MAVDDRTHWDGKYASAELAGVTAVPERFEEFADHFASASTALEIACGAGQFSVWLAAQGVQVRSYDISPVAVAAAERLAAAHDVADKCHFATHDFDAGLPAGEPVDLIMCNLFRDAALDQAIVDRLRSGGTLAIAALSEVGAAPGRFRVPPGELTRAFNTLDLVASDEANGVAWLLATKP